MIKLIASDLDGTLLDEPNRISKENLNAIEYAYQKGAKFCFATGRDLNSINEIAKSLTHSPVLILGNGAEVLDEDKNMLFQDFFKNEHLKEVCGIMDKHEVDYMIFATEGFYTTKDPSIVREKFIERITAIKGEEYGYIFATSKDKPCNNLVQIEDMDEFVAKNHVLKVEGFHIDEDPVEQVKIELEKFTDLSHLSTGKNNVEVTNLTATKGIALKKYCEMNHIHEDEVMVLGDSHNDLSMFDYFKYSYAPSNSTKEILDKAYKVVCGCDKHAVAEAIYDCIQ